MGNGEGEIVVPPGATPNGLTLTWGYTQGRLTDVTVGQAYRCELGYDAAGRLTQCAYVPAATP
jgi:hypothetical protein